MLDAPIETEMDIVRDESVKRKKRRKQVLLGAAAVLAVVGITLGVGTLKPAAPSVEYSTIWPDTVKRGSMMRQVRGLGTLVPIPEDVRLIPAETDVRVERVIVLPGTPVTPDTVIMELSNPTVSQEAIASELDVKSAEAEYHNTQAKVNGDLGTVKAGLATVEAEYENAKRDADANKELNKIGVLSDSALKASLAKAHEMEVRRKIEEERISESTEAIKTQMQVQQANIDQKHAMAQLRNRQLEALKVRAGISGVLQELPVQVGQRVAQGAILAKVVQPDHLKAELNNKQNQEKIEYKYNLEKDKNRT